MNFEEADICTAGRCWGGIHCAVDSLELRGRLGVVMYSPGKRAGVVQGVRAGDSGTRISREG